MKNRIVGIRAMLVAQLIYMQFLQLGLAHQPVLLERSQWMVNYHVLIHVQEALINIAINATKHNNNPHIVI